MTAASVLLFFGVLFCTIGLSLGMIYVGTALGRYLHEDEETQQAIGGIFGLCTFGVSLVAIALYLL